MHNFFKKETNISALHKIQKTVDTDCYYWQIDYCMREKQCLYKHDPNQKHKLIKSETEDKFT